MFAYGVPTDLIFICQISGGYMKAIVLSAFHTVLAERKVTDSDRWRHKMNVMV